MLTTKINQFGILLFVISVFFLGLEFTYAQTDLVAESEVLSEESESEITPAELNRISELAEKFLAGTITEEERAELDASGTDIQMIEAQSLPDFVDDRRIPPQVTAAEPVNAVEADDITSLRTMFYGLVAVNGLLVVLFSMYIWRRRHITSVIDPIE